MFCPRCRDEYREGFTHCQDCAVDLVDALPPEAPPRAGESVVPIAPAPGGGWAIRMAEVALVYSIGFGSSLIASLHHLARDYAEHSDPARHVEIWSNLARIAGAVPPLCVLAFVLTRRGRTLRDLGLTFRWLDLPLGMALMLVAWPNLLALLVRTLLGLHVPPRAAVLGLRGVHLELLAPISLLAVLLSAAAEELIVRAYLMSEILDLTGSALLAIGVSVLLQDAYHLYQGLFAFGLHLWGFLIFALFYWKTRRATPVVLAHFLTNVWLGLH